MIGKGIAYFEHKAKEINRLKAILNTILANGCYSIKEMDAQILKAQNKGNLDDEELQIITKLWQLRKDKTRSLIKELDKYIGGLENEKTTKDN